MKLRDIIFCDDIRNEINNKFSLMGIYADKIVFKFNSLESEKWPLPVKLCLLMRVQAEANDPLVDLFTFSFLLNGKKTDLLNGEVKMEPGQHLMTLNIIADGLPVEKGTLGFELKLYSKGNEVFSVTEMTSLNVFSEIVQ